LLHSCAWKLRSAIVRTWPRISSPQRPCEKVMLERLKDNSFRKAQIRRVRAFSGSGGSIPWNAVRSFEPTEQSPGAGPSPL
jgi:hypothetical protein